MRFRLARQEIAPELSLLGAKKIKENKFPVGRASNEFLKELAPILEEIKKRGIPEKFVLKKLKKNLGHGIFLHPEAKPIEKGEPIGPYSGEVYLSPKNSESDSDYIFCLVTDFHLTKEEQKIWDPKNRHHPRRLYAIDLDAEKKGNFTRFINHSDQPNVEAYFAKIPSNRLGIDPAPFELIYVAKKTIHPGEQLLVCYEGDDKSYWGALKIKPFPITPKTFQIGKGNKLLA